MRGKDKKGKSVTAEVKVGKYRNGPIETEPVEVEPKKTYHQTSPLAFQDCLSDGQQPHSLPDESNILTGADTMSPPVDDNKQSICWSNQFDQQTSSHNLGTRASNVMSPRETSMAHYGDIMMHSNDCSVSMERLDDMAGEKTRDQYMQGQL